MRASVFIIVDLHVAFGRVGSPWVGRGRGLRRIDTLDPHAFGDDDVDLASGIDLDDREGLLGQLDVVLRQAIECLADSAAQAGPERVAATGRSAETATVV